jgi:hypothetical protein
VSGFTEATLNIGGGLRVKDGIFRVRKIIGFDFLKEYNGNREKRQKVAFIL